MPAFIQLTDTHIVLDGELAYGRSDTATTLSIAVNTVNARLPLVGDVNCVIVTGDLTDHGTAEEYARFKTIMSRLKLPYQAVPGNHDNREVMRSAFADQPWMPEAGPIHWLRDFGDFVVIALDTLKSGAPHGEVCDQGFQFLDASLKDLGSRPVVIATHHPWMHSGIQAMDANNLHNGDELIRRLEDYPGPARMTSGHVHRAITTQIGKVSCQIAPAPCHAVYPDLRDDAVNSLTMEPGAVTLWRSQETPVPGLISNVLPVGQFAGPWPFYSGK